MAWNDLPTASWTPTVVQSGSVTVTVNRAKYTINGNIAVVNIYLTVTGSGTGNNVIVIGGQPVAIQPSGYIAGEIIGIGRILDTSASTHYVGGIIYVGATDWRLMAHAAVGNYVGVVPNFALANNDVINLAASYPLS
jgi:hypothetical protein